MWDVLVNAPKFGYKAGALESMEGFNHDQNVSKQVRKGTL